MRVGERVRMGEQCVNEREWVSWCEGGFRYRDCVERECKLVYTV